MSSRPASILVAACGNPMAGEDAFGPLLAELLRREPVEDVEAANLGMNPGGLLDLLDGRRALVIADAAVAPGGVPGTLIDCDWDDASRPGIAHDDSTSTHGLSIAGHVELARTLGMLPTVVRLLAVIVARPDALGSSGNIIIGQLAPARLRIARLARAMSAPSLTETRYV